MRLRGGVDHSLALTFFGIQLLDTWTVHGVFKERCFNKTRSGYVNSLFFVSCLAQAATRTQSFAIEERRPRPKGLRDVKRGKRSMKKQAETFTKAMKPHARMRLS